ncbi:ElyC/SanA/YdcF family protein [soil metagenome]
MKKLKKLLLFLLIGVMIFIITIFGLNIYIRNTTSSSIYNNLADLPNSHTVIILGASVHSDGKLSPILQDRVDTGLKLYRQRKANRFLVSGDNRSTDYDEVNAMKNYLVAKGVPPDHIFTDPAGIDTYDSMYRAKAIYNVSSATVVTQEFHLPRTLFIARNLGFDFVGYPANPNKYQTEASLKRREKLANFKALYEVFFNQVPASMGAQQPITGTPI